MGCEEEVIASGQISSREGEEGGNKGGEEEEGEVGSSLRKEGVSLYSLSVRLTGCWCLLPPVCSGSLTLSVLAASWRSLAVFWLPVRI